MPLLRHRIAVYSYCQLFVVLLLILLPVSGATVERTVQQQQFLAAERELTSGAGPRYRRLRRDLADYPLGMYLDYQELIARLHHLQPEEANAFIRRVAGTPLKNRFLAAYIEHKGQDKRWAALLGVLDSPPNDPRLQCFYYRAQASVGNKALGWQGAARLWNVDHSQDKACDPLFQRWLRETDGPSDDLVWSRALKAFDARQPQLIRYLTRFASPSLAPKMDELVIIYRRPDSVLRDTHVADRWHAELMTAGIRRLARVNPEQARQALRNVQSAHPFTDSEIEAMERSILRHSLFAQASAPERWILDHLERLADDELTEIFLRNQVREGNWPALLTVLPWLSPVAREKDQWRYWRARALEWQGRDQEAQLGYQQLALERSYHGFLAADKVQQDYQLNEQPAVISRLPDDDAAQRLVELRALGRNAESKSEWRALLGRLDTQRGLAAAQWAMQQGWFNLAIDAANYFEAWNEVALRFPVAFTAIFEQAGANGNVDALDLMAIARRESAFYPQAESRAGALGLMQLMPSTARQVAKKMGVSYRRGQLLEPHYNVILGSHYYQSLLTRFDGHRPKALAGYNAGPHRVVRWSKSKLPVDQWIDSLPFKETREYVQAVLAYAVIYRKRAGQPAMLLTDKEWSLLGPKENV